MRFNLKVLASSSLASLVIQPWRTLTWYPVAFYMSPCQTKVASAWVAGSSGLEALEGTGAMPSATVLADAPGDVEGKACFFLK